jgi:hypothetical protein
MGGNAMRALLALFCLTVAACIGIAETQTPDAKALTAMLKQFDASGSCETADKRIELRAAGRDGLTFEKAFIRFKDANGKTIQVITAKTATLEQTAGKDGIWLVLNNTAIWTAEHSSGYFETRIMKLTAIDR